MKALVAVLLAVSVVAAADPDPAALRAQGEELARSGSYSEAIDLFKAADRIRPSAADACLIALAYTRRELWPQAEVWLAQCQVRSSPADPLPEWAPDAAQQIRDRLAAANVAPVEITVTAPGALVTVSSFAPDEQFPPRTIHLPPGHHVIFATAPGYLPSKLELDIADRTARHVTLELRRPTTPSRALRYSGYAAFAVGAVAIAAGVKLGLDAQHDADVISGRTSGTWTPADHAAYDAGQRANRNMIISYVAAGVLVTGGVVLLYLDHARVAPYATPTEAGVAVAGRF